MADFLLHGPAAIHVNTGLGEGRLRMFPRGTTSRTKKHFSPKEPGYASPARLSRLFKDVNSTVLYLRDGLTESEREDERKVNERKQVLAARMENARTLIEWETAATELDQLEGNDEWKLDDSSADYNSELVEEKLRELDQARTNCDIGAMMYLIRTSLSRDLGGMGNVDLYRHSYIGTNRLIERYVDSAIQTIEALVEKSSYALPPNMEQKDLLEGLLYARQSFGRSALLLSGGATFGMAHVGVLKAMFNAQLLPRILSGSSAGSIVCAVLCTRNDEEIPALLDSFPYGDLDVFEGDGEVVADHIRRLLTEGHWSDIKNLKRVMRSLLGDLTFQEAYNRTRRICNICVSSASIYELPRLLNYVTAPNIMIWSAVAASCSVPLVFRASPLLIKDPATGAHMPWNPSPQQWIDGSVDNDLPMTRLAEMFNVNHFIVSQVNPHVVPFLSKEERLYPSGDGKSANQAVTASESSEWLYTLTTLARDEVLHRFQFLTELGVFPNLFTKLRSVVSQKYSGDITILPEIALQDLPRILSNPTPDFMLRNCLTGERATWPKLSCIRDRCAIELALDRAVLTMRARVVFSKSQVDLRRLVTGSDTLPGADDTIKASEPLACLMHDADDADEEEPYQKSRRRRNSVGNIQGIARHRRVQNLDSIWTDDETEQEARLEMRPRNKATPAAMRTTVALNSDKPRLKRASKSHAFLPSRYEFDLSDPTSPPSKGAFLGDDDSGSTVDEGGTVNDLAPPSTMSNDSARQDTMVSPTENASDPDPRSSDADADVEDSRTDESDMEEAEALLSSPDELAKGEPNDGPTTVTSVLARDKPRAGKEQAGLWS